MRKPLVIALVACVCAVAVSGLYSTRHSTAAGDKVAALSPAGKQSEAPKVLVNPPTANQLRLDFSNGATSTIISTDGAKTVDVGLVHPPVVHRESIEPSKLLVPPLSGPPLINTDLIDFRFSVSDSKID